MTQEAINALKICPECQQVYGDNRPICPQDGKTLTLLQGYPPIGATFADRYQIMSLLGSGGMSIIYKARHKLMDRIVAIKVLHPDLINDPVALERFQQESKAAATLAHPNVVTVYDFGISEQGQAFFVMDCLEGPTLDALLEKEGHLPPARALNIFKQICDGLEAAHRKGIIHRDLKPPNIALVPEADGSDLVKILDFGVAKFLPKANQQALRLTQTGEVFGSPLYMSPEQCLGKTLDARSDLYALGCLMYETLTGFPTVIADSFLEALNKHVGEQPKSFKEVAPSLYIPEEIEAVVFKCLAKEPEQRLQSAGEIRDALSRIVCEQAMAGDLITKKLTNPPGQVRVRPITISLKTDSKILTWFAAITGCLLIVNFAFIAFWPGPPDDRGTPLSKLTWQITMSLADSSCGNGNYSAANQLANFAESLAKGFGDNHARLLATLDMKTRILRSSGQYADLEKINDQISTLKAERIRQDYVRTMACLNSLSGRKDGLQKGLDGVTAQASIDKVYRASDDLGSISDFEKQEELLRRCKQVLKDLNVHDEEINANLDWRLADCLLRQQHTLEIRPLLLEALELSRKSKNADTSGSVVQALLKLGIFDKDQSDFPDSNKELQEAVTLSKKQGDKHLAASCLSAYADYFHQLHDDEKARKLFAEANQLDSGRSSR
jgi:serine/threonine protein kinase